MGRGVFWITFWRRTVFVVPDDGVFLEEGLEVV